MRAFNSRAGLLRLPCKEKRGTFPMKMKRYDRLLAALCALVLLAAAVLCLALGVWRGETETVFRKAVNICMECIGLG